MSRSADGRVPGAPSDAARPLLLQGQEYLFRSPPKCLDFQEQVHRLGMVDEGDGNPATLRAGTGPRRRHGDERTLHRTGRARHPHGPHRRRPLRRPAAVRLHRPAAASNWTAGCCVPLLVWRRHFELSAIPIEPGTLAGAYAVDQWASVANWLSSRSDWAHVNPSRFSTHLDRLTQLSDAASFGLRVPRTAVTTRPGRTRPGGGRCIVKTAGRHLLEPRPGVQHGLFPRPLETSRASDAPEPAPVIVQEYVPSDTELRVFVVGERCIAFQVDKTRPRPAVGRPRRRARDTDLDLHVPVRPATGTGPALARPGGRVRPAGHRQRTTSSWRSTSTATGAGSSTARATTRVSAAVHDWVALRFKELLGAGRAR